MDLQPIQIEHFMIQIVPVLNLGTLKTWNITDSIYLDTLCLSRSKHLSCLDICPSLQ